MERTLYPNPARRAVVVPVFRVGDVVTWEVHQHGRWYEFTGRVVVVLPANTRWSGVKMPAGHTVHFDSPDERTRDHTSYLVSVPHPGKGKPALYYPKVTGLSRT